MDIDRRSDLYDNENNRIAPSPERLNTRNVLIVNVWLDTTTKAITHAAIYIPRFKLDTNTLQEFNDPNECYYFFSLDIQKIKDAVIKKFTSTNSHLSTEDISQILKSSDSERLITKVSLGSYKLSESSGYILLHHYLNELKNAERRKYPLTDELEKKTKNTQKELGGLQHLGANLIDSELTPIFFDKYLHSSEFFLPLLEMLDKMQFNYIEWRDSDGITIAKRAVQRSDISLFQRCIGKLKHISLPDSGKNSILHDAVICSDKKFLDEIMKLCTATLLETLGENNLSAIELATLQGKHDAINSLLKQYNLLEINFNLGRLLILLIHQAELSPGNRETIKWLVLEKGVNLNGNLASIGDSPVFALPEAIRHGKLEEVGLFIEHGADPYIFPNQTLTSLAEDYQQTRISNYLREKLKPYEDWLQKVFKKISAKAQRYINREAEYQGKKTQANGQEKEARINIIRRALEMSPISNKILSCLYPLYLGLPKDYCENIKNLFKEDLALPTREASINIEEVVSVLKEAVKFPPEIKEKKKHEVINIVVEKVAGHLLSITKLKKQAIDNEAKSITSDNENTNIDDDPSKENADILNDIETFCDEFEFTFHEYYAFYLALDLGRVERKEDESKELANQIKTAVGVIPNLPIPLPVPASSANIKLPTSMIICAAIDLAMYVKEVLQRGKDKRIAGILNRHRPLQRALIIRTCAEMIAYRHKEQIKMLSAKGIQNFANMAVVRIFSYIERSGSHVQRSGPSFHDTLGRKVCASIGINLGPQPERVYASLNEISMLALSEYTYHFIKTEEEEKLLLKSAKDRHGETSQWTAKGIFELTGIMTEDGYCYGSTKSELHKYGYAYSTAEEANARGMKLLGHISELLADKHKHPWYFEERPVLSQSLAQLNQQDLRSITDCRGTLYPSRQPTKKDSSLSSLKAGSV